MSVPSFRFALMVAAFVLVCAGSALARTVGDPAKARDILAALDDSAWIADGAANDRHVYVLYSTACGWCRQLYAQTRERDDALQWRWVLHGGAGAGAEYVAEQGTVAAIGRAFDGNAGPVADREQALRTLDLNAWLSQLIGGQLAYPTFIYAGRDGLQVAVGARGDLDALRADVVERPGKGAHRSSGIALLAQPLAEPEALALDTFINFQTEPLPMHALPDLTAMRIGEVGHMGMYQNVHGTMGSSWIVVTALRSAEGGGRDIHAYIHAPEAVALAHMTFDVLPASGTVVAETQARPLHSHPTRRAPVLDELAPGYQLDRVGEVHIDGEVWDAVVFFQDGGRAYLPR